MLEFGSSFHFLLVMLEFSSEIFASVPRTHVLPVLLVLMVAAWSRSLRRSHGRWRWHVHTTRSVRRLRRAVRCLTDHALLLLTSLRVHAEELHLLIVFALLVTLLATTGLFAFSLFDLMDLVSGM